MTISGLKPPRRSRLPEPPPKPAESTGHALSLPDPALPHEEASPRIDGRTRRATGRTLAFATRVSPEWKARLDRLAKKTGKLYCVLLEEALDALECKIAAR